MATHCAQGKREASSHVQVQANEAGALSSLCDLPVNLIKQDERSRKANSQVLNEEFDFRLRWGPFCKEPEMCAADEVFFQGQILPSQLNGQKFNRHKSRSLDFLDHVSLSESRSNSSRSSSFKSQNSSNSTSSTTILTPRVSESRVKNRFHTCPSPKPQLRVPIPRQASFGNLGRKSSTWDFFRLGVVPVPEIELQDLKVRGTKNTVSRNGSTSNSRSNSGTTKSGKMSTSTHYRGKSSNHGLKQFLDKGGGFLSGCKCSVETVPLDTVIIINSRTKSARETESATRAMKEKVAIEFENEKQREKKGKKTVSSHRRRTFEWLKELSHASYPDEEAALLLNS
ncbi:uncharacterized protein LOC129284479 [Prosopis cineraria]|uniref:uncharacterized protein LOC129284479 n=1 Tax=Prosopis cineraria TaxID=364024 RepID=UPI00241057B2|nr:uncharacterized protein LOC129284479 [Prosopis cineraria]